MEYFLITGCIVLTAQLIFTLNKFAKAEGKIMRLEHELALATQEVKLQKLTIDSLMRRNGGVNHKLYKRAKELKPTTSN